MGLLRPLLICLSCLSSCEGVGVLSLEATPNVFSATTFARANLLRSPFELPPAPEPLVLSLDETDIDEEESDEAVSAIAPNGSPFESHAAFTNIPHRQPHAGLAPLPSVAFSPVRRC